MPKKQFQLDFNFALAIFLIAGASFARLVPHPPNFTPVGAIALFSGAYLNKKYAVIIPMATMLISDLFLAPYPLALRLVVYLSFALVALLGIKLRGQKRLGKTISFVFAGSLIFYFFTNFAVWALTPLYPPTISGLGQSYLMALPFLRNSLAGNFFYTGILFGLYETFSQIATKKNILGKRSI